MIFLKTNMFKIITASMTMGFISRSETLLPWLIEKIKEMLAARNAGNAYETPIMPIVEGIISVNMLQRN